MSKTEPKLDTERMTQQDCAEAFGVTPRTLRQWEDEARVSANSWPFPRNRDGTYPLKGMMCWLTCKRSLKSK